MKKIPVLILLFQVSIALTAQQRLTVAKDGPGEFSSVQQAINAVKDSSDAETIIYIKNGVYKERLMIPEAKNNIHFIGESVEGVVLTYDNYASKKDSSGKEFGTSGSSSFFLFADGFTAENITFENSSGPVGQAVAARITGDKARFIHCRFLGFQDTLYTHGSDSRQYYSHCYIEGTVDFIFGAATALFDSCTIYGKKAGYYTAASTLPTVKYGYVFKNCNITGDATLNSFDLGRPWRPDAKVVFMHCSMGNMVRPEGWNNWGNEKNEATAYFAEYDNSGEGYQPGSRVKWSHQLTAAEAATYTIPNMFGDWDPTQ